jgi:signal transduction histidine kinase
VPARQIGNTARPDRALHRLATLEARVKAVEQTNRVLEREVVQRRLAEELARSQTRMLVRSLGILATEAHVDEFLGHVLKVTVQQLHCVGGTLWFPDPLTGRIRLHLEYLDGRVIGARESRHPAVLQVLPVGGRGVSTFPTDGPEIYPMTERVAGMPEENRAYIQSLGVRALLTVPMRFGRKAIGWICLRSSTRDPSTLENKTYLAEALANQATLAVQMAQLGEEARHAAVLAERNRIARDIHDTLAQGFTGILLNLEAASLTLRGRSTHPAQTRIADAKRLAKSCLAEARVSVEALRPPHDPAELPELIRCQALRLAGVVAAVEVRVHGEVPAVGAEARTELARILQESVTNILKHANATRVEFGAEPTSDALRVWVTDDGVGFDPVGGHEGFGLVGMTERAQRMGARLIVESAAGRGTRVETVLPRDA